mmetsp:Transcript_9066/g.27223  ORF Transcript_9066/g.27223 Transcript_9066/m.27223 type:complete len:242 (-) Transcript_9066:240-965(-)
MRPQILHGVCGNCAGSPCCHSCGESFNIIQLIVGVFGLQFVLHVIVHRHLDCALRDDFRHGCQIALEKAPHTSIGPHLSDSTRQRDVGWVRHHHGAEPLEGCHGGTTNGACHPARYQTVSPLLGGRHAQPVLNPGGPVRTVDPVGNDPPTRELVLWQQDHKPAELVQVYLAVPVFVQQFDHTVGVIRFDIVAQLLQSHQQLVVIHLPRVVRIQLLECAEDLVLLSRYVCGELVRIHLPGPR